MQPETLTAAPVCLLEGEKEKAGLGAGLPSLKREKTTPAKLKLGSDTFSATEERPSQATRSRSAKGETLRGGKGSPEWKDSKVTAKNRILDIDAHGQQGGSARGEWWSAALEGQKRGIVKTPSDVCEIGCIWKDWENGREGIQGISCCFVVTVGEGSA